ncbi:MAG: ABC transporter substrate-binding protein, partial [Chloroflexota bacterium]
MKGNKLFYTLSIVVIAAMVLAACGGAATLPPLEPNAGATKAAADLAATQAAAAGAPVEPAGCAEAAGTGAVEFPSGGKTVTGGWDQEPDSIVPYFTQMSYAIWITQLTLVGLGEWDDNGSFVPELAAEVPTADNGGVSPDGLTITWKLKDCLYWSDGERITSADVKFTWDVIMDPGNAVTSRTGYDKIASVETPDDLTVVIKFAELYPPWQVLFTQGPNNGGAILPKHILEGQTGLESNDFVHQPSVASGPFVIAEWVA